jgi:hypothetical protein
MTTTTVSPCRPDEAFAAELRPVLKPLIAARAREVALAIVQALDFAAIADEVWNEGEFDSGPLGEAIAVAINRRLIEETVPNLELPDGCER